MSKNQIKGLFIHYKKLLMIFSIKLIEVFNLRWIERNAIENKLVDS